MGKTKEEIAWEREQFEYWKKRERNHNRSIVDGVLFAMILMAIVCAFIMLYQYFSI